MDLLRLARRLFVLDAADAVRIVIDVDLARRAYLPGMTGNYATG
jgi:hypothetical protein